MRRPRLPKLSTLAALGALCVTVATLAFWFASCRGTGEWWVYFRDQIRTVDVLSRDGWLSVTELDGWDNTWDPPETVQRRLFDVFFAAGMIEAGRPPRWFGWKVHEERGWGGPFWHFQLGRFFCMMKMQIQ